MRSCDDAAVDIDGLAADDFVQGVHDSVYLAAVRDAESLLAHPPGRAPGPELQRLSTWWRGLSDADREAVRRVMELTSDLAVFGFLCVLDNVRTVADSDVYLRLEAVVGEQAYPIPQDEATELHDLFKQLKAE